MDELNGEPGLLIMIFVGSQLGGGGFQIGLIQGITNADDPFTKYTSGQ
jgi:hypothetical protein